MLLRSIGLIAFTAIPLAAQMVDCPGISADGYKVLFDNLSISGANTDTAKLMLNRLRQKVQFDLTSTQLETTPQTVLVPCRDRTPQDVTDFNPSIVDSLNGHRVLIEIWGQIEARTGLAVQRAQLNFTLVPISFYDRPAVPPTGFSSAYEQRLRGTPDDLAKLFGEFSDLKTYVSIAAGVKSLKEHQYDQAYACFCRATTLLTQSPAGMQPSLKTSLLRYVGQKVNDTYTQAHADRSTPSRVGVIDKLSACPGALP